MDARSFTIDAANRNEGDPRGSCFLFRAREPVESDDGLGVRLRARREHGSERDIVGTLGKCGFELALVVRGGADLECRGEAAHVGDREIRSGRRAHRRHARGPRGPVGRWRRATRRPFGRAARALSGARAFRARRASWRAAESSRGARRAPERRNPRSLARGLAGSRHRRWDTGPACASLVSTFQRGPVLRPPAMQTRNALLLMAAPAIALFLHCASNPKARPNRPRLLPFR